MAGVLRPALSEARWASNIAVHDFLKPEDGAKLQATFRTTGLDKLAPEQARILQPAGYFYAFFLLPQRTVILTGHPPKERIKEALVLPQLPSKLLLSQEDMHSAGTKYEVWDFQQSVTTFPLNTPLEKALKQAGMLPAGDGA
ncbi:MAG: hypothetical protein HY686_07900 [Chloroflexi bacterium]|nr:hypothetical protein [Chloroflexota bacterium]